MDPLSLPYFSRFVQPRETITSSFGERLFHLNSPVYELRPNGTLFRDQVALPCYVIAARVAIIIFATLLVIPLICLVYNKWKNRQLGFIRATELRQQEEIRVAGVAASEKMRAAERKEKEASEIVLKAREEAEKVKNDANAIALSITAAAISRAKTLRERNPEWYKEFWKCSVTAEGTLNFEKMYPNFPPFDVSQGMITVVLSNGKTREIPKCFLPKSLIQASAFTGLAAEIESLKKAKEEKEKKEKESKEVAETGSLDEAPKTISKTSAALEMTEIPAHIVELYLQILSGASKLENLGVDELIQLFSLAEQYHDKKTIRILLELLRAIKAIQPIFLLRLITTYIEGIYDRYPPGLIQHLMFFSPYLKNFLDQFSKEEQSHFVTTVLTKRKTNRDLSLDILAYRLLSKGIGCVKNEKEAREILPMLFSDDVQLLLESSRLTPWEIFNIGYFLPIPAGSSLKYSNLVTRFYRKAGENGLSFAKFILAKEENFVSEDERLSLLQEAADEGEESATETLGDAYFSGNYGLKKDYEKALFYYRQAAVGKSDHAILGVGEVFGKIKMYEAAKEQFEEVLRINPKNKLALKKMGKYWCFIANEFDYRKSFDYYSRAAALGDPDANFWLGLHYRYGWGIPQDLDIARGLFGRDYSGVQLVTILTEYQQAF